MPPRTFFFAGKAAPAYQLAKLVIKFINNLAGTHRRRSDRRGRMKVVFVPDYRVSLAEWLIPGQRCLRADLDRRLRSQRHQQHEVHDERRADDRHAGRRHHRDGRGGGGGELFPFRPDRRPGRAGSRGWYNPAGTTTTNRKPRRARPDARQPFQPGEPGSLRHPRYAAGPTATTTCTWPTSPVYTRAHQRLGELYADPEDWTRKAILNVAAFRQVLQRPHHYRVRQRNLERQAMLHR